MDNKLLIVEIGTFDSVIEILTVIRDAKIEELEKNIRDEMSSDEYILKVPIEVTTDICPECEYVKETDGDDPAWCDSCFHCMACCVEIKKELVQDEKESASKSNNRLCSVCDTKVVLSGKDDNIFWCGKCNHCAVCCKKLKSCEDDAPKKKTKKLGDTITNTCPVCKNKVTLTGRDDEIFWSEESNECMPCHRRGGKNVKN